MFVKCKFDIIRVSVALAQVQEVYIVDFNDDSSTIATWNQSI